MTNYEILKVFQLIQLYTMEGCLHTYENFHFLLTREDTTEWWNYVLVNQDLTENQIKNVEDLMLRDSRAPLIYFENVERFRNLRNTLISCNFEKSWEDSWMFYSMKDIQVDKSRFDLIRVVETKKEMDVFLETMDKCYQKDDPKNPYGELGEYLDALKTSWLVHENDNFLEFFIAYKNNNPVAVSTLTNFFGLGYISNVGSVRDVRGEGFGKLVSLYAVHKSQNNGNSEHFLATEEGEYPNEFYKRIGFETKFTAVGYKKS